MKNLEQARGLANDIYEAGLKRVKGFDAVYSHLSAHPLQGDYKLVAFGKAGSSMALGALAAMSDQISDGLVITKHDHTEDELRADTRIRCIESDHPVPGQASIDAGQALVDYIQAADSDARFLVLISGGASSLIEVLPPGMTLDTLSQLTDTLLSIGFDITQMNQVRRAVSCIKGGRLANYINGRETRALLISDVPGDDPAVIGSGPLTPVDEDIRNIELPPAVDESK